VELVDRLCDRNAWQRATAARLLLERQDKETASRLLEAALYDDSQAGRIHALWALEGMGLLYDHILLAALNDIAPRVVEEAVEAAAARSATTGELRRRLIELCHHADARVRFAALLAVAPHPTTPTRPVDPWEAQALLIAAGSHGGVLLANLLADAASLKANVADAPRLVADAARLAAASGDGTQWRFAVESLLDSEEYGQAGLASFLSEMTRGGTTMDELRDSLDEVTCPVDEAGYPALDRALAEARAAAVDRNRPDESRCEALALAAFDGQGAETIAALAVDDASQAVRRRAIALLGERSDLDLWRRLLADFSRETPMVQRAILDGLLARDDGAELLLDEIASGRLKPTALDAARSTRLLQHPNAAIKQRAAELFADAIPADRRQALADYQTALTLPGDPRRGREVFAAHCATCHKIGDVGANVGPDISDSREKTPAQLLTDILQPSRAVDASYFSYTALTVDGLAVTGILTSETSTSVTLRESAEKEVTLRRDGIEQLASSGASFMPEGLEREIPRQAMADLIAFIKNWRYLKDR
jgi:putative heme-binding domain-containing protein